MQEDTMLKTFGKACLGVAVLTLASLDAAAAMCAYMLPSPAGAWDAITRFFKG